MTNPNPVTVKSRGEVNLTEESLEITITACTECGALDMIRFTPGPIEIDNRARHKRWHLDHD